MIVVHTKDFEKAIRKLPTDAKGIFRTQEERFREDWRDTRLHVKKLRGLPAAFSFRVTRRYRVLFYFDRSEEAIFFDIGHRKGIYE